MTFTKNTVRGIKCPILLDRLLTLKTPCRYRPEEKVKTYNKLDMVLTFPEGVVGAVTFHEEKTEIYEKVCKGDKTYWLDYEYKVDSTLYTPIYERGVRVTLSWRPNVGANLSEEGWVESNLCPSIGGWVRVTARTEGNLSNSLEIPQASSIEEASAHVFKLHSTIKVLNAHGHPTGEVLPEGVEIPTEEGRHLVTNTDQTRWWIVDTVEVTGPPSR